MHWAENVLATCLRLREGEMVLTLVDEQLRGVGETVCRTARQMGAGGASLLVQPRLGRDWRRTRAAARSLQVVPSSLLEAVRRADVILSLFSDLDLSRELTPLRSVVTAFRAARRGRWAFGAYVDEDVLEGELAVDYREVARIAAALQARLEKAREVRIRTARGTDLTLRYDGRPVHADTGILTEPGAFGNLPAGEVFVAPLEGSAEGQLVVDLSLGDIPLPEPVTLTFERGRVVAAAGGAAARELVRRLGPLPSRAEPGSWGWTVGEFGLGANPVARIRRRVASDEKVLGTAHVALGANVAFGGQNPAATHYDCVIDRPEIFLDGIRLDLEGLEHG